VIEMAEKTEYMIQDDTVRESQITPEELAKAKEIESSPEYKVATDAFREKMKLK
jgi:hypothetical protein